MVTVRVSRVAARVRGLGVVSVVVSVLVGDLCS